MEVRLESPLRQGNSKKLREIVQGMLNQYVSQYALSHNVPFWKGSSKTQMLRVRMQTRFCRESITEYVCNYVISLFYQYSRICQFCFSACPLHKQQDQNRNTVIPHCMHTSLDALPHLMHTKPGNQLSSCVKIIKFKGCMNIHLMRTEKIGDPMFYFARYRFSLVNTEGTDTVMLSSYMRHVWHLAHVAHSNVMIRYNKPHLMHYLTWRIGNWSTDDMHQVRYYCIACFEGFDWPQFQHRLYYIPCLAIHLNISRGLQSHTETHSTVKPHLLHIVRVPILYAISEVMQKAKYIIPRKCQTCTSGPMCR